jgi:polysaccharide deacetylase 2 family uncharacterized protein YibQ
MPPAKSRTAAKKPAPKRRSPKRRSRFGLFTLVISVPLLAVAAFLGYQFFTSIRSAKSETSTQPETRQVPIRELLTSAGIEPSRIRATGRELTVESFASAEEIARKLRKADSSAHVTLQGDAIAVSRGTGSEVVHVVALHKSAAAEGFEPAAKDDGSQADEPPPVRSHYEGEPRIALIIDDVGFDRQPVREAASLPGPLTFAVIPGTPHATESADFLSEHGFQILCHLPMEPLSPSQSGGPLTILTSMSSEEIRQLARENIRSIPHAHGVNNHMGSKATRDQRVMNDVVGVLREEGMYFVDSRTGPGSVGERTARRGGVKTASRDVFLDDVERPSAIRRQFDDLVEVAQRRGTAIGIGHMYPVTISVLSEELPRLRGKGIRLVPVSEIVH